MAGVYEAVMETMISKWKPQNGNSKTKVIEILTYVFISVCLCMGGMCQNFAFLLSTPDDYNVRSYFLRDICHTMLQ